MGMVAVSCEGSVNPYEETDYGMNTLSFYLDGEGVMAGAKGPDWLTGMFARPREEGDENQNSYRAVRSGLTERGDSLYIDATPAVNSREISRLYIRIPLSKIKKDATIDDLGVYMPYISGWFRDESFTQGIVHYPHNRVAEFKSGSLHVRSWKPEEGILSGEFEFEVLMVEEGVSSAQLKEHMIETSDYRPYKVLDLSITRGNFDVNYRY